MFVTLTTLEVADSVHADTRSWIGLPCAGRSRTEGKALGIQRVDERMLPGRVVEGEDPVRADRVAHPGDRRAGHQFHIIGVGFGVGLRVDWTVGQDPRIEFA